MARGLPPSLNGVSPGKLDDVGIPISWSVAREPQIGFVSQQLKDSGLFVFVEKFRYQDIEEYERRELQKDYGFKARYFSREDVIAKGKTVLTSMNLNEVTLDEMATALRPYFRHCYITWKSGNYYRLVASNSLVKTGHFIASQGEPAIPDEYVYEALPPLLFSDAVERGPKKAL
ncbi:uncharacterized protein LDX57_006268 [Aspergillus melleus]|uniref:uncharacterized protein n=1 Tax=Aspergillus melleus TaxID=138277 RepID=UPI001E8E83AF|nr:uncharacterized protein LDX57_006268 [Aspergillus melleus]KAH8428572.1 hypothetical protein LDX57_006268 [Aspergillus melleus]